MTARMSRGVRVGVAVVAVFLVLAGLASAENTSSAPLSITRGDDLIVHCTAARTRAALGEFVQAFNAGEFHRLNALFAGPSWFRWYSSGAPGERYDPKAQKRSTLIGYFRARHRQSDRLRIVSFQFNGNTTGYGNFEWKMRRSAADLHNGAWFRTDAKGAVLCRTRSVHFIAMSVGGPGS
jgi:hypothetical protein